MDFTCIGFWSLSYYFTFELSLEIVVLFVSRKLIFQTRMLSHPVGLDVWFLVVSFVCFHTSCVRTVKTLARLRGCAGSLEPSLVAYVISTIISWADSFVFYDYILSSTANAIFFLSIFKTDNNLIIIIYITCISFRIIKSGFHVRMGGYSHSSTKVLFPCCTWHADIFFFQKLLHNWKIGQ